MTSQVVAGSTQRVDRTEVMGWQLRLASSPASAPEPAVAALSSGVAVNVPESVLGVLVRLGLAPDVSKGGDEAGVMWARDCTWSYRCEVPRFGDGRRVSLLLEGVDTLATVLVDGVPVVETDNMFHAWEVDLGRDDEPGAWRVEVVLHPVLPVAQAREASSPLPRADMYELPFNQVRKMASSFGWDWGPTTVTTGLWRRVMVLRRPESSIADVRLSPTWREGAVLGGEVRLEGDEDCHLGIEVCAVGDSEPLLVESLGSTGGAFEVSVPGAARWNVVHRGAQPLYDVRFVLTDGAGGEVDVVTRRVGFRSVELAQERDEVGRRFEVHVNGKREWIRGYNWIPADVLPERATRELVRSLVSDAVACGANMLRVWGGGVIESDDLYDACDEFGVLVWQDFGYACAAYEDGADARAAAAREVEHAVRRIGYRASLALWCGSNENLWGYEDWGWKEKLPDGAGWGAELYFDAIPTALARLDPCRPYIPGSPFSPDEDVHPNDPTQGPTHHWDTWNQLDYVHFEAKTSRFASEFGWQAPASWPTLVSAMGHEPTSGDDPDLQRFQKHPEGRAALARAIGDHVPHLPKDGPGWYFATQLVQARALEASIGRFRSMHHTCSGALWWQLNDCWPALSWAVVDVAGRRKLAWFAAAKAMAPRAVVVTADGDPHALTVINDTDTDWSCDIAVTVVDDAGRTLSRVESATVIAADGWLRAGPDEVPPSAVAVVVDADGRRGVRWIVPDLDHVAVQARVRLSAVSVSADRTSLTFTADSLVRELVLLAETDPRLGSVTVDSQLATLLPGESHVFEVTGVGTETVSTSEWARLVTCATGLEVTIAV